MKRVYFISALLLLTYFSVFTSSTANTGKNKAEYFDVSKSVVMVKHEYGSNIACVATKDGLFFVDCGMKTELVLKFRQEMEKRFNKKTLALLITHPHIDHYLGMGAFSDVNVIAAETGKNLWERQLGIDFNEKRINAYTRIFPKFRESIKTAKPFKPTAWFKDKKILGKGKEQITFTNTGGHTSCSSSVYFPKERILIARDLVQVDQYPYFGDPSTDMNKWMEAFKVWEKLPIKKVCPGHGRVVDKKYIKTMRKYFESLISALKKLKKENLPAKEVVRHKDLPEGYWPADTKRPVWFDFCIASLYSKL